jgi:hypothetical protein
VLLPAKVSRPTFFIDAQLRRAAKVYHLKSIAA